MSTPEENSALHAELERIAQSHVESAREQFAINLDYSEATLAQLDEAIAKFHPDGRAPDDMLLSCGAYVGETIRRSLGGIWIQDERGVALLNRIGGIELSASPFSWVQKRFANGMADSIEHHYGLLRQQVGQVGVRLPSAAPSEEEELSDEEWELLVRAPLLVFMAVAVADGKLDKKEMAAFEKVVANVMTCATPLLRQAMAQMLPEMEYHLEQLQQQDSAADLARVAHILDTDFADEALAFKHSLVTIGIQIAEASGGFLGFGNKISKEEGEAIAGIAVILGVVGMCDGEQT